MMTELSESTGLRRREPATLEEVRPRSLSPTRHRSPSSSAASEFLAGKSHFLVLFTGMMLGYLLLPVLLIEVQLSDFLDRLPEPADININNANNDLADIHRQFYQQPQSTFIRQRFLADTADDAADGSGPSDVEQRLREDHDVLSKQSMPTATTPYVMKTLTLPDHHRKKILVTGGAGFVGSHLVDKLMMEGHEVIVVDNFFTGQKKNIAHWLHHPLFR